MIEALRFVQGAVATKDYVPELTHFRIAAGHIMGFNGRLALCSPIDLDITAAPKASVFAKALLSCGNSVSLNLTPNGRLAVKSEGFRVYIDCIEDYAFDYYPVGDTYPVPAGFLDAIKTLAPFMGEDASRPWCMALHLNGHSAYVTNNIIAVEYWIGADVPTITIPHSAIREVLRLGLEPISLQTDGSSVTFWYGTGKWLRSQLVEAEWPLAPFVKILNSGSFDNCVPADQSLFEALNRLKPFMPSTSNRVLLLTDKVATSSVDGDGAEVDVPGIPTDRAFNRDMLALVGTVAEAYDLQSEPGFFTGQKLRGVIMGMAL